MNPENYDLFNTDTAVLTGAGNLAPDPAWHYPAHSHTNWEFIYFLRGTGLVEVPQATFRPQQYHLMVYPPGLPHAETSDPYDPEETIFLSIEVKGTPAQGAHLLLPDKNGDMGWLCRHILDEVKSVGASKLAQCYGKAFLCLVENAWKTAVTVQHDAVDLVVQYIHVNYSQDVNLDELAGAACLSKDYLSRCFNARLKMTPLRYLQQYRLDIAKRLLVTTDLSIREVAIRSGFYDPYYFSRVLKATTGDSPANFRKHHKSAVLSMSDTL